MATQFAIIVIRIHPLGVSLVTFAAGAQTVIIRTGSLFLCTDGTLAPGKAGPVQQLALFQKKILKTIP